MCVLFHLYQILKQDKVMVMREEFYDKRNYKKFMTAVRTEKDLIKRMDQGIIAGGVFLIIIILFLTMKVKSQVYGGDFSSKTNTEQVEMKVDETAFANFSSKM